MQGRGLCVGIPINPGESSASATFVPGGLFLDDALPSSFASNVLFHRRNSEGNPVLKCRSKGISFGAWLAREKKGFRRDHRFLSVSLSVKGSEGVDGCSVGSAEVLGENGEKETVKEKVKVKKVKGSSGALNMTKHLWAGAVAAMVSRSTRKMYASTVSGVVGFGASALQLPIFVRFAALLIFPVSCKFGIADTSFTRTCVAPLERLKLEYIVRGEQKNLFDLIKRIFVSQGLKGFWKGNFVNILRTAPFKAINFYAYDTYRSKLLKMSGNEEATNFERFLAGAGAGITATLLCLPMDTIRTKMVAPGGEALGGVIGTFRHMVQTEGFFSLYKGLVPSLIAMAPSGAVFYGVYDILKSAYLNTPEGKKRLEHMKQEGQELNALEQLELGPIRTLLYGAIAGVCCEAATYPFEVVRRQLQMQVRSTRLSPMATCIKIVQQGGVPALYAGLIPSLLQVLPSAAISYFVYEFMKIVLKVEST